jgi:hypothetical protein
MAGSAEVFTAGSWVWVPDDEHCYLPLRVGEDFAAGSAPPAGACTTADGHAYALSAAQSAAARPCDEACALADPPIDDLVALDDLSEVDGRAPIIESSRRGSGPRLTKPPPPARRRRTSHRDPLRRADTSPSRS